VVSKFCKAINFCNSAFTLYSLLKRSGFFMTAFISLMITQQALLGKRSAEMGGQAEAAPRQEAEQEGIIGQLSFDIYQLSVWVF